jgi:hypothetical protein
MQKGNTRIATFPLRLPLTMRREANELAHREGLSLNHFISLAVAEKIVRMENSSRAEDLNPLSSSPGAVEWRYPIKQ